MKLPRINRPRPVGCALLSVFVSLAQLLPTVAAAPERPNILWLVSEDNTTLLGCYGDPLARTPTLDKLAREGVLFERCFAQPVCASSRFTLITGTFAVSSGPANHMRAQGRIPSWLKGFPALLREAGYYTANNAKTDYNAPINPKETWNESGKSAHYRNRPDARQPFFSVFNHEVTHESCMFPEQPAKLGFTPTDPTQVRVPQYQPDTPEIRADWARYYDQLALMDSQVGAKLKSLADDGLAENTIVFYYADNGGVLPRSKRFLQASGTHVPLIVYFPPKWRHLAPAPPGARLSQPVSFVDFAPTVLSLGGVKIPDYLPGRAFAGPKVRTNEFVFCTRDRMDERYDMMRSVMDSRWLYIHNYRPDLPYVQPLEYMFKARGYQSWARLARAGKLTAATAQFWGAKPTEELYDLAADPDNVKNLAGDPAHRTTLERMRDALKQHTLEIVDNGFLPEGSALEGYEASRISLPSAIRRICPGSSPRSTIRANPYAGGRRKVAPC
jgi:arylsulfatase A-like enzyme